MSKKNFDSREQELRRKNEEIERKKRQIQAELDNMKVAEDYLNFESKPEDALMPQVPAEDSQQRNKDIISEIEAVNRIQAERNAARLKELKEQHANNVKKSAEQKQKITILQNNIEQGERALELKDEAISQLQSKGKKISEESKKWIAEITKLTDRCQELRDKSSGLNKQLESLTQQLATAEKAIKSSENESRQLQHQQTQLTTRISSLTEEITLAKEHIKQNNQINSQELEAIKKHNDRVRLNQKRMERQKAELIKAFRKLSAYIQLIRKQNVHIQTARSLNFTQEEFLQAVDKTDRM